MDEIVRPAPDGAVLIVGAGLAGLFLALRAAPRPVIVVSPAPLGAGASSAWAQGGIAAALAQDDSPELHAEDTIAAGAGLVDPVVAKLIATDGPERVRDLLRLGVPFDRSADGVLALSLEAAHSRPRVARVAGDLAGREIMAALIAATRAAGHITVLEGVSALALLEGEKGDVSGVLARDGAGALIRIEAGETVLATGGVGGLYRVTTNPVEAAGQGLGMAARAGALIADAEFVQFHPTAIDIGRDPAPLATEALRGEGATLVDAAGRAFMADHDPRGDLASRDIVARAIASERAAGRKTFLDCRSAVGAAFPEHFPTVFAACRSAGVDPRVDPIPVAPAAHYHMGGIATDLWGKTSLEGLSAVGECASTGAHGANRLASNSLLEAVVFADRIARRLVEDDLRAPKPVAEAKAPPRLAAGQRARLRDGMAELAGVVRDEAGLARLLGRLDGHGPAAAAPNEIVAARLIVEGALARRESRGGHWRVDHPEAGAAARGWRTLAGPVEAGYRPGLGIPTADSV